MPLQGDALAGVNTRKSPFDAASPKPVRAKHRQATVEAEAARLNAVLQNAAFLANPIAAVTHHVLAALPPAPAPKIQTRKNTPGSQKRKTRRAARTSAMQE